MGREEERERQDVRPSSTFRPFLQVHLLLQAQQRTGCSPAMFGERSGEKEGWPHPSTGKPLKLSESQRLPYSG